MLDLYDYVVIKFVIETFKEFNGSIGTIGVPIAFIEGQVVVDEGTEEYGTVMRSQSTSELAN